MNNSNANHPSIEKGVLELQKLKLETQKILLENRELKRSTLLKPQWLAFITAFVISLTSFFFFVSNGSFDAKFQEYKAQKATLELSKIEFRLEVDSLHKEKDTLLVKVNNLKKVVDEIKIKVNSLRQDSIELQKNKNKLLDNISNKDVLLGKAYRDLDSAKDSIGGLRNMLKLCQESRHNWRMRFENVHNGIAPLMDSLEYYRKLVRSN
jgi:uncharacterized coiled-coil DUF342 family protein